MARNKVARDSTYGNGWCVRDAPYVFCAILLFFAVISIIGITWGLPSRKIDKYLFGGGEVWSGEKIYRLANADVKLAPDRASRIGADVDIDPLTEARAADEPITLTAADEDIARIYLRYRLYTYQPDEMITMMALAGMRPSRLELDPRLYQYGGLFIYPVGALIKLCGLLGFIDVRSDVIYYLDHPDEFGKFYIVARAYSAAWGLFGVILVYAIASRLGARAAGFSPRDLSQKDTGANRQSAIDDRQSDDPLASARGSDRQPPVACAPGSDGKRAGVLAALLFTLMPVVVCMSHEGKPHLPGAVLMLAAVYFAIRSVHSRTEDSGRKIAPQSEPQTPAPGGPSNNLPLPIACDADSGWARDFSFLCLCCGAAVGMVLSSWPICVLIPLVAWLRATPPCPPLGKAKLEVRSEKIEKNSGRSLRLLSSLFSLHSSMLGLLLAVAVYFVTNPYVLINAFVNRDVLRSNFGNSLAMYQITRIGEGFVRVVELTIEGATLPILVLGLTALVAALARKHRRTDPTVWVLTVPAAVFFLQFVAIGAGKPAEYGRFGIFPNAALAVGASCLLNVRLLMHHRFLRLALPAFVIAWLAAFGGGYLRNFHADTTDHASRLVLAERIRTSTENAVESGAEPLVAVFAEPAPYGCPPLNFLRYEVMLLQSIEQTKQPHQQRPWFALRSIDTGLPSLTDANTLILREISVWEGLNRATPISWANKPFDFRILGERSNRPEPQKSSQHNGRAAGAP